MQIEIRERPMSAFEESEFTFKAAFEKDKTFSEYGNNSLLVFVLAMYAQAEDPAEFAAESLTDGAGDKKESLFIPVLAPYMRAYAVATGTEAAKTFKLTVIAIVNG